MRTFHLLHFHYLHRNSKTICTTRNLKTKIDKITHCIFDVDGTLIDTEPINLKVYDEELAKYGHQYTLELRQKIMGAKLVDAWKILARELKIEAPLETLVKSYRKRSHDFLKNCPLKPGVEKLLLHLNENKVPLAIATSGSDQTFALKQEPHKKLFSVFHHIVCGGTDPDVQHSKPAPDIFLICASRFPDNPHPSNCLVFEDAPNGINGAFKAGMKCVAIPDKITSKEECKNATVIIDSLEEFIPDQFGLPPYKN